MKVVAKITLGLALTIMLFLSLLCILDIGKHFFAGGSIESTMVFFLPNKWIVSVTYLLIVTSVFFLRKNKRLLLPILIILTLFWCSLGRSVGLHWTGKLVYGWFNIETGRLELAELFDASHENLLEQLEVKKEENSFYGVKIIGDKGTSIYLGPYLQNKFLNYFKQHPSSSEL